jgi:hypothetical protein
MCCLLRFDADSESNGEQNEVWGMIQEYVGCE